MVTHWLLDTRVEGSNPAMVARWGLVNQILDTRWDCSRSGRGVSRLLAPMTPRAYQGRGQPVAGSDEPEGRRANQTQDRHTLLAPLAKKKITIEDIFLNESVYIFISF